MDRHNSNTSSTEKKPISRDNTETERKKKTHRQKEKRRNID